MKKLELELQLHEKDFRQVRAKFDEQIANQANEILQQKETIQQQSLQIMDLTQKKNLAESDNMRMQQELSSLGQEHELVKNQTQKLSMEKQENQTEIQRLKKISGIKDNPKKAGNAVN